MFGGGLKIKKKKEVAMFGIQPAPLSEDMGGTKPDSLPEHNPNGL